MTEIRIVTGESRRETYNLRCKSSLDSVVASNVKGSSKSVALNSMLALWLRNSRTVGEGGTRVTSSTGTPRPPNETSPTSSYTHSDLRREL